MCFKVVFVQVESAIQVLVESFSHSRDGSRSNKLVQNTHSRAIMRLFKRVELEGGNCLNTQPLSQQLIVALRHVHFEEANSRAKVV